MFFRWKQKSTKYVVCCCLFFVFTSAAARTLLPLPHRNGGEDSAKLCENAERGMTVSQPASTAFNLRSPCRWLRKPIIDVAFFSLARNFGISTSGFAFRLFRSKTNSAGRSPSGKSSSLAIDSLSPLMNSTFIPSLRAVSEIFAWKNRSSMKQKMRVGAFSRTGAAGGV